MSSNNTEILDPRVILHEEITLCLYAVIGMVGLAGNAVLITVHITTPSLRQKYILCLGLSDFVVCGNFVAMRIAKFFHPARWTQAHCMVLVSGFTFSLSTSTVLTLAVGLDRILALTTKTKYEIASDILFKVTIVINIIYPSLTIALGNYFSQHTIVPTCLPPYGLGITIAFPYWNYSIVLLTLLVIVVYVKLGVLLKGRGKTQIGPPGNPDDVTVRMGPNPSASINHTSTTSMAQNYAKHPRTHQSNAASRRHQKLIGSILIVALIHVMSWTFTNAFMAILGLTESSASVHAIGSLYVGVLAVINNSCNPYIYCFRSTEQRKAYLDVLAKLINWRK